MNDRGTYEEDDPVTREVPDPPREQPGSFGFRPKRSAHDALRALNRVAYRGEVNFILEADITSFFDSVDRTQLMEMLRERVVEGSILRLVGKCLHVGVLEGSEYSEPDKGTTQGSVLSPLLGNVYLHYVLDAWFERECSHYGPRGSTRCFAPTVYGADTCHPHRAGRARGRSVADNA